MDPNATLAELRSWALNVMGDPNRALATECESAECFLALDEWLSNGGFMPSAWQTNSKPARVSKRARRVQRGAAWLDSNMPGWVDKIELGRLDMRHGDKCIAGQLFGNYANWRESFPGVEFNECRFGFDAKSGSGKAYRKLTKAWRKLIEKRRNTGEDD